MYALKSQIFQRMWFKVFIVFVILLLIVVLYLAFVNPPIKKGEIGNEQVWQDYEEVAVTFNNLEFEGVEFEDANGESPDSNLNSEELETSINMFFFAANKSEQSIFTSSIAHEILEKDFFEYGLQERFAKIEEAMQRISRNSTLTSVEVIRTLPYLKKDVTRVVLDLSYSDLAEPIRVNVLMKTNKENAINTGSGETYDIPYIDVSIWELIDSIEGKVK